mgnify:CR=1 FL=1
MKKCSKCNKNKLLTCYRGNTSCSDGFDKRGLRLRRPECKDCGKIISQGKNEAKKLAKKLSIPYKAPQGSICAICGKPPKQGDELVFDHCHEKNIFRGYLHNSCNRSLGVLGDNIQEMIKVINFLNQYEKKNISQDKNTKELKIIKRRNSF